MRDGDGTGRRSQRLCEGESVRRGEPRRGSTVLVFVMVVSMLLPVVSLAGQGHSGRVRPLPDLVESRVGSPPATVHVGAHIRLTDVVLNRGDAKSKATTTGYFLGARRIRGRKDLRLGSRR